MSDQGRADTRLLIVDGHHDAADSLALLLKLYGYPTRTAYTAVEALRTATDFQPHVILSEVRLPDVSGYDMARCIRRVCGHAVFVAVTTLAQDTDRVRSRQAGFAFHLVKPVEPDLLFEVLVRATPNGGPPSCPP